MHRFPASGKRELRLFVTTVALALMTACAITPPPAPVEAPPVPTFEMLMADAAKARLDGSVTKERELFRAAAASYPTRKEPWSHLADSYFAANDYGNAILAAQEVLQRDAADPVANSILAVSGLRVSTGALGALRQQQSLSSDTRGQAEDIVKTLREVLGEPVLVRRARPAAPATGAAAASVPGAAVAPAPGAAAARPTLPPAAPPPAATTRPATASAPASAPANPFDRLR
jgi:hypothetical protein